MTKKNKKLIRYTDRDFNSIKEGLVDYARRYYPDIFKDFSEASFGSLMLDTVAYAGDILSFYLDYQTNESFLDTAVEYDNILRLGEQVGYKQPLRATSFGLLSMYVLAPVEPNGTGPDVTYLPILARGSKFTSESGQIFTLIDDVDFSNGDNEIVTATANVSDGAPTAFAVKAYGRIISGEIDEEIVNVGDFARFLNVPLADPNITEIVSVTDTEGHEYFEVDYLSQDTIFRSVVNKDPNTRKTVPNIIVTTSVPRRYTVFYRNNQLFLKFGYGSESSLKTDPITHPSNVVLKMHGKGYETDTTLDPSKLLETDKFGIAPANTSLRIIYRTNTLDNVNSASRTVTSISDPLFIFRETATNEDKIAFVRDSIEVVNEEPITGDVGVPSVTELKQRINDVFASQNRAVTAEDYEALVTGGCLEGYSVFDWIKVIENAGLNSIEPFFMDPDLGASQMPQLPPKPPTEFEKVTLAQVQGENQRAQLKADTDIKSIEAKMRQYLLDFELRIKEMELKYGSKIDEEDMKRRSKLQEHNVKTTGDIMKEIVKGQNEFFNNGQGNTNQAGQEGRTASERSPAKDSI